MFASSAAVMMSSTESWACMAALRALDDALDEISAAADEVRRLAAEATWQSKGVEKLRIALAGRGVTIPAQADRVDALRASVAAVVV
jgi:hypothetical protein